MDSGTNSSQLDRSSSTWDESNIYINAFPNDTILQNENATFEDIASRVNLNISIPQNLNIAMVGDSITRFLYLDLAYFLSHGSWIQPNDTTKQMVWRKSKSFKTFFDWMNWTHYMLKPYEQCDCHCTQLLSDKEVENRYFFDKNNNNRIAFLTKLGDTEFRSSWEASDIWNSSSKHHYDEELRMHPALVHIRYTGGWENYVKDYVCKMEPKPDVLVFNSGHWDVNNLNNELKNVTIQNMTVQSLKDCGIISVYRTTTKREVAEYERQLCNLTDICMDVSWTTKIPREHYLDRIHYWPPIYSMLNMQLMSTILTKVADIKSSKVVEKGII